MTVAGASAAGKGGVFGRLWRKFGEVARKLGLVGDADVRAALEEQESSAPRKKIGEILVERGKLTPPDVKRVLEHQARSGAGRKPRRKGPARAGRKPSKAARREKGRG